MSDRQPDLPNRQTPFSEAFRAFIAQGWAPYPTEAPAALPASGPARERRTAVSRLYPGERVVVPAGGLVTRSNDTDYRFRPHSAFAHLTGLGTDREPDAVLVLEPTDAGHDATLYIRPRAPRDSAEFYANPRYGEMWVGQRPSLEEMSALVDLVCADIADLPDQLGKDADTIPLRVLAEAPDPVVTALVARLRASLPAEQAAAALTRDAELTVALSELRLVKDAFEVEQLRQACAQTADGFAAVVADLPEAVRRGRGERWVEGVFGLHARHGGNTVGYDTIAAS
ncbi:MAG: aminopeptidase family protein, partial [Friedmanniella sp.]|nr:aminopeptidase family protein [Friedmanniella sp.]